jgi:hypothetical protein
MKRLRQEKFFEQLSKKNISVKNYGIIVNAYITGDIPKIIQGSDGKMSSKLIKLVESMDVFFQPVKKQNPIELMGEDYLNKIKEYVEIFPTKKLPNNKYARTDVKNLQTNFEWFFKQYSYSWNTILKATELYVEEYRKTNYLYMRTSFYFIRKAEQDKQVSSDLANYCDRIINSDDYKEERFFKTNVV